MNYSASGTLAVALSLLLSACGGGEQSTSKDELSMSSTPSKRTAPSREDRLFAGGQTILGLFGSGDDPNTKVGVNKYIWNASLEVLNFLPVQSIDPFTGVISTGYGVPPGGGRAYRATIYVQDPALDARSLKVALQTQGGGTVSAETQRAVEDAILTRARQLRVRDSKL